MKDLFAVNSFKTIADAETFANHLVKIGVPRLAITLGAERDLHQEKRTSPFNLIDGSHLTDANNKEDTKLLDRIVGIFQSEDAKSDTEVEYDGFRSALALGEILILVEKEYRLMIEQTLEQKATAALAPQTQIPSDADDRIQRGGSFASEDLAYQPADELAAPLKASRKQNSLGPDVDKDPHRLR